MSQTPEVSGKSTLPPYFVLSHLRMLALDFRDRSLTKQCQFDIYSQRAGNTLATQATNQCCLCAHKGCIEGWFGLMNNNNRENGAFICAVAEFITEVAV